MASKALLIGINKYQGCPLQGCVPDIYCINDYLLKAGLFTTEQITMLLDEQATTTAIHRALLATVTDINMGDRVLVYYSGHGAQVNNPRESDGLSEVLVSYDFDWSPERMITDSQMAEYFGQIPDGVKFNMVSDSCHSQGQDSVDRELFQTHTSRSYPTHNRPAHLTPRSGGFKNRGLKRLPGAFIYGCLSTQTSADAYFDNKPRGALSYYFLKQIEETPDLPLEKLLPVVNHNLKKDHYTQTPGVDGPRSCFSFLG